MSTAPQNEDVLEFSTPGSQRIDAALELNNKAQIDGADSTAEDSPCDTRSSSKSPPETPSKELTKDPKAENAGDDQLEPVDESHLFEYPPQPTRDNDRATRAEINEPQMDTTQGEFTYDENGNPLYSTTQFQHQEPQLGDDDFQFDPDPVRAADAKARGNKQFAAGKYEDALECYAEALLFCPEDRIADRLLYHNNKCAAHVMLHQWEDAVFEASAVVGLEPGNIKGLSRRAKAYESLEQYQEAIEDYKTLQHLDPKVKLYGQKVEELTKKNEDKFEKQKAEMVDKLKGWGNSVLGWFGMSTDNFQFVQDPNSGSYSVNFVQNPGQDGQPVAPQGPQGPQQPQHQQQPPGGGSSFSFTTQRP